MIEKLDDLYGRATNKALRLRAYRPAIVATATPIVSFTFDDVPDTALTAGARILEAHGVRGSFYIAGGLAGRVEPGRTLIDLDGCRELAARGHEIGCHTYAHDAVRRLGPSALAADLDRNAAYLGDRGRAGAAQLRVPLQCGLDPGASRTRPAIPHLPRGGDRINRGPTDLNFLNAVEIRQPEESSR
nr:polysaccharide deacetylase family protein [Chenggangzhangella methanolivorans]